MALNLIQETSMETTSYLQQINTTPHKNNISNETYFDQINEVTVMELFEFYYTPLLIYVGIFGNILSVYVFFSTKLKKLSSTYYLGALALSDSGFLLSLFGVWLKVVNIDVFNQPGFCQLIVYLTSVCSFLSVWLVVSFTVERFIAVRYPLLRQSVCTVARARLTVIILTIIAITIFLPLLIFASAEYDIERKLFVCRVNQKWQDFAGAFNAIDTLITFIIPVVIIAILNGCISRTVWKLAKVRRRLTGYHGFEKISSTMIPSRSTTSMKNVLVAQCNASGGETKNILKFNEVSNESFDEPQYYPVAITDYNSKADFVCPRLNNNGTNGLTPGDGDRVPSMREFRNRKMKYASSSSQTKVTKMLLVVSSVFLGLNLPSYVMRILAYLIEVSLLYNMQILFNKYG